MTQKAAGAGAAGLVERLRAAGRSVATAESLTGGLLAARITDVPGASQVFRGGVITYATELKVSLLAVPDHLVAAHGVVSSECAAAMAAGARDLLGASYGVATTGVAGPGSLEGRPAGTVWIAVAGEGTPVTRLLRLSGDRSDVRRQTCTEAIALLHDVLRREVPGLG